MAFSLRLTEDERNLAESYAKLHSFSLSEAFKRALFEKIEDEYDLECYYKAMDDYEKNPKTYTSDEVKQMLKEWDEEDESV